MLIPNSNRIVLLVEDSDDDAFFFERSFQRCGIPASLVRVADGAEAVAYLQQTASTIENFAAHAVMFLDLKLPVMSGFEVLRWVREHQPDLQVIVLSGSELQADIDAARELGARDYLTKPISAMELRRRLSAEAMAT